MTTKWFPGVGEFSPSKCAHSIRDCLRPNTDNSDREYISSLWKYHTEYLRVTAHADSNRPSKMADGTVVYYSWQAATEAMFFATVFGMATGLNDKDDNERDNARTLWKDTDWEKMWDDISNEQKRAIST